jgi:predicted flap endonuclease-1-like 5' DNA nuclease
MLTLLARIIFIAAAGFGLRTLGGRTQPRRARAPARRRVGGERRGALATDRNRTLAPVDDTPSETGQAAFASFGGSAVSAAVAGKPPVAGAVERLGAGSPSGGHGGDASSARAPGLADPAPNGPTARPEARDNLPADALAEKHRSPAFANDFRSVDYGGKVKPAWPHRDADGPDDGWTVPDPATDHRVALPSDSPAAFKGSGGAAPVRGAPVAEEDGGVLPQDAAAPQPDMAKGGGEGVDPSVDILGSGVEAPANTVDAAPIDPVAPAPAGLDAPRDGVPDDLTRISGVEPSIERLLFASGIFHFDQIAGWTPADVRWADRLTGFAGRAAREKWVEQARRLAGDASGS